MPCRSGMPLGVRSGVQAFPPAVAFVTGDRVWPAARACANSATTTKAASADETRKRCRMGASFCSDLVGALLTQRAVQQLFGELHALVFKELCVLLDATI